MNGKQKVVGPTIKSYSSNNNVEKRIPNAASTAAATEQPQATYNDIKLPSVPGETEHPKNSESQYESTEATEYNQTVLQTQENIIVKLQTLLLIF